MYNKILVTLDTTCTDRPIIDHIKKLAMVMNSKVVLMHVADGWAARTFRDNAVSEEITGDTAYLAGVKAEFEVLGVSAEAELAYGDPAKEIVKWVKEKGCDLIAMSTHGHKFFAHLVYGETAQRVQHNVSVPVLLLRAC